MIFLSSFWPMFWGLTLQNNEDIFKDIPVLMYTISILGIGITLGTIYTKLNNKITSMTQEIKFLEKLINGHINKNLGDK